jgi:hypothetical protein
VQWLSTTGAQQLSERKTPSAAPLRTASRPFPNLPPWLERSKGEKRFGSNAKKAQIMKEAAEMRAGGATIATIRVFRAQNGRSGSFERAAQPREVP